MCIRDRPDFGVEPLAAEVEPGADALLDGGGRNRLAVALQRARLAVGADHPVLREAERLSRRRIRAGTEAEARVQVDRAVAPADVAAADLEEAARRELVAFDRRAVGIGRAEHA